MKQAKLKKSQRKNLMKVKQIIKQDHVISYDYEISGDWKKYFTENNPFFVEYNKNIEYVPNSIAIIPLIGNSLIAAALFQAVIEVEEVDETFMKQFQIFYKVIKICILICIFIKRILFVLNRSSKIKRK